MNKFYYILDGDCYIEMNDCTLHLTKGDFCMVPEGCVHSYRLGPSGYLKKHWVHFNSYIEGTPLFKLIKCQNCINIGQSKEVEDLFNTINCSANDFVSIIKRNASLTALVCYYLGINDKIEIATHTGDFYELIKVLIYMEENLEKEITLEDLSSVACLHPNYLIKKFKNHFGRTPIKYMNNLRLNKAKDLLSTSNLTILEIAHKVGFKNVSYFSNQFKRKFEMSPNMYRKIHTDIILK